MNGNSLADGVIKANKLEQEGKTLNTPYSNVWGIDEYGFHWPNPVNAQAIAAAAFLWHGRKGGIDNIFRVGDDIFIGRKKVHQNKNTLLALFDKPKIMIWANDNIELQDREKLWKQIKQTISSEYPIIWKVIVNIAPEYSKEYIRIVKGLVWDKNNADILYM